MIGFFFLLFALLYLRVPEQTSILGYLATSVRLFIRHSLFTLSKRTRSRITNGLSFSTFWFRFSTNLDYRVRERNKEKRRERERESRRQAREQSRRAGPLLWLSAREGADSGVWEGGQSSKAREKKQRRHFFSWKNSIII